MPKLSCSTLATGARQLVVQLALLTYFISAVSLSSFTPSTQVRSGASLAGALSTTRLRAGLDVRVVARLAVLRPAGEDAGALDDHVDLHVAPRQLGRIPHGQGADLLAVDDQILAVVADRAREAAMRAVVLQQRRQHLVVREVVDRDDLELALAGIQIPKCQPADAAESIDCNSNCHFSSSDLTNFA